MFWINFKFQEAITFDSFLLIFMFLQLVFPVDVHFVICHKLFVTDKVN